MKELKFHEKHILSSDVIWLENKPLCYYYFKFRTPANTQQDTVKVKMDVLSAYFITQVSY